MSPGRRRRPPPLSGQEAETDHKELSASRWIIPITLDDEKGSEAEAEEDEFRSRDEWDRDMFLASQRINDPVLRWEFVVKAALLDAVTFTDFPSGMTDKIQSARKEIAEKHRFDLESGRFVGPGTPQYVDQIAGNLREKGKSFFNKFGDVFESRHSIEFAIYKGDDEALRLAMMRKAESSWETMRKNVPGVFSAEGVFYPFIADMCQKTQTISESFFKAYRLVGHLLVVAGWDEKFENTVSLQLNKNKIVDLLPGMTAEDEYKVFDLFKETLVKLVEHRHIRPDQKEEMRRAVEDTKRVLARLFDGRSVEDIRSHVFGQGENSLQFMNAITYTSLDTLLANLTTPGAYDETTVALLHSLFSETRTDETRNAAGSFNFLHPFASRQGQASARVKLSQLIRARIYDDSGQKLAGLDSPAQLEDVLRLLSAHETHEGDALRSAQDEIRAAFQQTPDPFAFLRESVTNVWESLWERIRAEGELPDASRLRLNIQTHLENQGRRLAVSIQDDGIGMNIALILYTLLQPGASGWNGPGMPHFGQGFFTIFKSADEVRLKSTRDGKTTVMVIRPIRDSRTGDMIDGDIDILHFATSEPNGSTVEWVQDTADPRFVAAQVYSALQRYVGLFDSEELSIELDGLKINNAVEVLGRARNDSTYESVAFSRMRKNAVLALNGSYLLCKPENLMAHLPVVAQRALARLGYAVNITSTRLRTLEGRTNIANDAEEFKRLNVEIRQAGLLATARLYASGEVSLSDFPFWEVQYTARRRPADGSERGRTARALAEALRKGDEAEAFELMRKYAFDGFDNEFIQILLAAPWYEVNGRSMSLYDIFLAAKDDISIVLQLPPAMSRMGMDLVQVLSDQSSESEEEERAPLPAAKSLNRIPRNNKGGEAYVVFSDLVDALEEFLERAGAPVRVRPHYVHEPGLRAYRLDTVSQVVEVNLAALEREISVLDRLLRRERVAPEEIQGLFGTVAGILAGEKPNREGSATSTLLAALGDGSLDVDSLIRLVLPTNAGANGPPMPSAEFFEKALGAGAERPIIQESHLSLEALSDDSHPSQRVYFKARARVVESESRRRASTEEIGELEKLLGRPLKSLIVQLIPHLSDEQGDLVVYVKPNNTRAALIELPTPFTDPRTGDLIRYIDLKGIGYVLPASDGTQMAVMVPSRARDDEGNRVNQGLSEERSETKDFDVTRELAERGIRTNLFLGVDRIRQVHGPEGNLISIERAAEIGQIEAKAGKPVDESAVAVRGWVVPFRFQDLAFRQGAYNPNTDTYVLEMLPTREERGKREIILGLTLRAIGPKIRNYFGMSPDAPVTVQDYVTWLADMLGREVGHLHHLGYIHGFIGLGHNVTLDARIVDMDSLTKTNSSERRDQDHNETIDAFRNLVGNINTIYKTTIAPKPFIDRLNAAYERGLNGERSPITKMEADVFLAETYATFPPEDPGWPPEVTTLMAHAKDRLGDELPKILNGLNGILVDDAKRAVQSVRSILKEQGEKLETTAPGALSRAVAIFDARLGVLEGLLEEDLRNRPAEESPSEGGMVVNALSGEGLWTMGFLPMLAMANQITLKAVAASLSHLGIEEAVLRDGTRWAEVVKKAVFGGFQWELINALERGLRTVGKLEKREWTSEEVAALEAVRKRLEGVDLPGVRVIEYHRLEFGGDGVAVDPKTGAAVKMDPSVFMGFDLRPDGTLRVFVHPDVFKGAAEPAAFLLDAMNHELLEGPGGVPHPLLQETGVGMDKNITMAEAEKQLGFVRKKLLEAMLSRAVGTGDLRELVGGIPSVPIGWDTWRGGNDILWNDPSSLRQSMDFLESDPDVGRGLAHVRVKAVGMGREEVDARLMTAALAAVYRERGGLSTLPEGHFRGVNMTDYFIDPKSPVGRQCELLLGLISARVDVGGLRPDQVVLALGTRDPDVAGRRTEALLARFPSLRGAVFSSTPVGKTGVDVMPAVADVQKKGGTSLHLVTFVPGTPIDESRLPKGFVYVQRVNLSTLLRQALDFLSRVLAYA